MIIVNKFFIIFKNASSTKNHTKRTISGENLRFTLSFDPYFSSITECIF